MPCLSFGLLSCAPAYKKPTATLKHVQQQWLTGKLLFVERHRCLGCRQRKAEGGGRRRGKSERSWQHQPLPCQSGLSHQETGGGKWARGSRLPTNSHTLPRLSTYFLAAGNAALVLVVCVVYQQKPCCHQPCWLSLMSFAVVVTTLLPCCTQK